MSKNLYHLTVTKECYFEVIEDEEVDSWVELEAVVKTEEFEFPYEFLVVTKARFLSKTVGPIPKLRTFRLTDGRLVEEKSGD